MFPLKGPHNQTTPGKVTAVGHATWSQRRAWHGDTVKMSVYTELAKDGSAVEIKVMPKDQSATIDTVNETLAAAKVEKDYAIQWKDKDFGEKREFVLKALVGGKLAADVSDPLYIDLDPPGLSC